MKNKNSEQFNICTFCLCASCWESGLQLGYYHFKFIGLHLGRETFTNPFYNWLTFSKISKGFTGSSYFNSTLFKISVQESLSLVFVCLKIYACTIRGFSCSLATSKSSLFGLHLGRETFQKPFYTWLTFSKIPSQNIKPHSYCIKQSKARNEKG